MLDTWLEEWVELELSMPLRVVTAALDGDLLAVLAGSEGGAFTGRQLARLAGSSSEGARQALARLVAQGIVEREPAGSAQMYRLNRDHLAAPAIVALAGLRSALLDRLRTVLGGWDPAPGYAALFGSVARGDERIDSDLDICVLRPEAVAVDDPRWRAQVADLERDATRWTGNDTRVLELAATDAPPGGSNRGADTEAGSVVEDVLRDGVPLAGDVAALRRLRPQRRRTRALASPQ